MRADDAGRYHRSDHRVTRPLLQTHKLKGKLAGSWACKASYDLRIVFKFVKYEGPEAVLLLTMGTHDEVY